MLSWPQASNSHTPFHSEALASKITEENLLFILKRTTLRSWKYQEAFINYCRTKHFSLCQFESKCLKGLIPFFKRADCLILWKRTMAWCHELIPKDPWGPSWNCPLLPSKGHTIGPWSQNVSPHFFSSTQELERNSTQFKTILFLNVKKCRHPKCHYMTLNKCANFPGHLNCHSMVSFVERKLGRGKPLNEELEPLILARDLITFMWELNIYSFSF